MEDAENTATEVAPSTTETGHSARPQSMGEEIANAVTHGVGALLALGCFVVAVAFAAVRGDAWRIVSASIYGTMMFVLYLSSALYHAAVLPRAKAVLNLIDHSTIYLMIAGCYTPFCLVPLRQYSPGWGWGIFGAVWTLAILGVAFQCCFIHRFRALSTLTYVLMGWMVLVAVYPLWRAMGAPAVLWLAFGGVAYTLGIVFYAWKSLKYAHAVWHLFVLGGTMVHFFTILFYVMLPPAAPTA
jgi:hemolysin III